MEKLFLTAYKQLVDHCLCLRNLFLSTDLKDIIFLLVLGGIIGILICKLLKLTTIKMSNVEEVEGCVKTGK